MAKKVYFLGYDLADQILGDDFISPAEVVAACKVVYSDQQLKILKATLPNLQELEWIKNDCAVLIPGPPSMPRLDWIKMPKANLGYNRWATETYRAVEEARKGK